MSSIEEALLVLADGTVFEGESIGAQRAAGITSGEVVFNTALTGYQEIITDPSYSPIRILGITASRHSMTNHAGPLPGASSFATWLGVGATGVPKVICNRSFRTLEFLALRVSTLDGSLVISATSVPCLAHLVRRLNQHCLLRQKPNTEQAASTLSVW